MLLSNWISRILAACYRSCILSEPDPFLVAKGAGLKTSQGLIAELPARHVPIGGDAIVFRSIRSQLAKQ